MTENVKKVIDLGVDIYLELKKALADGKIQPAELFGFLDELLRLQGVIEAAPTAWVELKNASHADRAEIMAYVEAKDIGTVDVEALINSIIDVAIAGTNLWQSVMALGGASDPS